MRRRRLHRGLPLSPKLHSPETVTERTRRQGSSEFSASYRCRSPFSTTPGSSRSWMDVAGPRSGSFHDESAQTTFLSGVTSKIWTVPAHSSVFLFPAHQLEITVLPLASRIAV